MPFKYFFPYLPVAACALALGLGGCVAAPLAQIAASQMMPVKTPCVTGPGCQTNVADGSFGDISKGIGNSFRKLTGSVGDNQKLAGDTPVK